MRRGHPLAPQLFSYAAAIGGFGGTPHTFFTGLLWPEGAVPGDPAASKEAMMHHALGKQKKDHC